MYLVYFVDTMNGGWQVSGVPARRAAHLRGGLDHYLLHILLIKCLDSHAYVQLVINNIPDPLELKDRAVL